MEKAEAQDKKEFDKAPPYARDFEMLRNLFVTQRDFKVFSDDLYSHISEKTDGLSKQLTENKELFVGEIQNTRVEISDMKDQLKSLSKAVGKPTISFWNLGKILGGALFFIFTLLGILALLHVLP